MGGKDDTQIFKNEEWYTSATYEESRDIIHDKFGNTVKNFVSIGYFLKHIRDRELFAEGGYNSIWEFAQTEFGLSKSAASRYMSINDKFSVEGNSPTLMKQFEDFSKGQLQEMIPMKEEELEQVTPNMTVKEIRNLREPESEIEEQLEGQMRVEDFPELLPDDCREQQEENNIEWTVGEEVEAEEPIEIELSTEPGEQSSESKNVPLVTELKEITAYEYNICTETIKKVFDTENCDTKDSIIAQIKYREKNKDKLQNETYIAATAKDIQDTYENEHRLDAEKIACIRFGRCHVTVMAEDGTKIDLSYYAFTELFQEMYMQELTVAISQPLVITKRELTGQEEKKDLLVRAFKEKALSIIVPFMNKAIDDPDDEKSNLPVYYKMIKDFLEYLPINDDEISVTASPNITITIGEEFAVYKRADFYYYYYEFVYESKEETIIQQISSPDHVQDVSEEETIIDVECKEVEEQKTLPVLKNNDLRKEWLSQYKEWGIWYVDEHIGVSYYKYDFSNGSRLVVAEYYYQPTQWHPNDFMNEFHLIKKDEHYSSYSNSVSELVEYLKELQKNG